MGRLGRRFLCCLLILAAAWMAGGATLAAPRSDAPQWRRTAHGWEDAAYWQTEAPMQRDGAPLEWTAVLAGVCAGVLLAARGPSRPRADAPNRTDAPTRTLARAG